MAVALPPCPHEVLTPTEATKRWDDAQATLFALPSPGEPGYDGAEFAAALEAYSQAHVAWDEAWRNDRLEDFKRAGSDIVKNAGLQSMYDGLKAPSACTSAGTPIAANWTRSRSRIG